MSTECYAMLRGSALRVTALDWTGEITSPVRSVVSTSVANVTINEVTESGIGELVRNAEDEPRINLRKPEATIRYTLDIRFLRVDPDLLALVSGVPIVRNAHGDVVGFDSVTRLPAKSFALEVWSRLAGQVCADGSPKYGYTLFPYLRGGLLSGFSFSNDAVTFNLAGAQTRRHPKWGVGPYDFSGPHERLLVPVSGNTHWRSVATEVAPPAQTNGEQVFDDIIDGGIPAFTTADTVSGGSPADAGPWIVDGGRP